MSESVPQPHRARPLRIVGALVLLVLLLPFAFHAAQLGWRSLSGDPELDSDLFAGRGPVAGTGLSLHMLAGAVITVAVPIQVLPPVRKRVPGLHRWTGRLIVAAGLVASFGGLLYIALEGTIGGPVMDAGFALYGLLLGLTAIMAVRAARSRDRDRHRDWALRLAVLILGSWLFRVHYGLWYALTGGAGSTEGLTGPFDRVQVFAFYLPYLAMLEWYLRQGRRSPPVRS